MFDWSGSVSQNHFCVCKALSHQAVYLFGLVRDLDLKNCSCWIEENPRVVARNAPHIDVAPPLKDFFAPRVECEIPYLGLKICAGMCH